MAARFARDTRRAMAPMLHLRDARKMTLRADNISPRIARGLRLMRTVDPAVASASRRIAMTCSSVCRFFNCQFLRKSHHRNCNLLGNRIGTQIRGMTSAVRLWSTGMSGLGRFFQKWGRLQGAGARAALPRAAEVREIVRPYCAETRAVAHS